MITASTVTTSVATDSTLDDELEIVNWICVLVATQGDGILFSPDSFQEEEAIKLCIGLGQVY